MTPAPETTPMTRTRLTASLALALTLLLGPGAARAQNVLLIWDELTPSTNALSNAPPPGRSPTPEPLAGT